MATKSSSVSQQLRADPIHLQMDWVHVYMLGNRHFVLSAQETADYLQLINGYLKSHGFELIAQSSMCWYLKNNNGDFLAANLPTIDPNLYIGQSISDLLPRGIDENRWLQLFNDIQMLLHDCEMNRQRKKIRQPTVDAIWLWRENPRLSWYKKNCYSFKNFLKRLKEQF